MASEADFLSGLSSDYKVPITGAKPKVATSATPKAVAAPKTPTLWDNMASAPAAAVKATTKAVSNFNTKAQPIVKKINEGIKAQQPALLKEELKTLSQEQRQALRSNAVPTKNGFMLPSIDLDPALGKFEGLTFTKEEWDQGFAAKYAQGTDYGKATGKEQVITKQMRGDYGDLFGLIADPMNAFRSDEEKFMMENESAGLANERMAKIAMKEKEAGFDYLSKIRASLPKDEQYGDVDWNSPMTWFNMLIGGKEGAITEAMMPTSDDPASTDAFRLYQTTREPAKSLQRSTIEGQKAFGGFLESSFGGDPYFQWASTLGQSMADDARIGLLKRSDLNPSSKISGDGRFGQVDYYTSAFASAIPHFVGSMMAATIGALATGGSGVGATAGAFGYSRSIEKGSMYNTMIEKGHTLQEANYASDVYGTIAGALDSLLPGELGGKIANPIAKEMLKEGVKKTLMQEMLSLAGKGGINALKEGVTEGGQEFMQNVTLAFYGENQDIWENVIDSFIAGALVGGTMSIVEGGDANAVRPPMEGTPEGAPQEDSNDESVMPEVATDNDVGVGAASIDAIEKEIENSLKRSESFGATADLGNQLIAHGADPEAIMPLIEEARKSQAEEEDSVKVDIVRYLEATQKPVIQNDVVDIHVGQTPTGEYAATGSLTVGDQNITAPYNIERTFPSQSDAVMDAVVQLESWLTTTLGTEGITNEEAMAQAVASLDEVRSDVTNLPDFVAANQEAVLTAQDAMGAEDFVNSMNAQGFDESSVDLPRLYRKATSPDAVRITGAQAKQVVQQLVGDLGIRAEAVESLTTPEGKRALGRFVQQVYGDGGRIDIVTKEDGTEDVNLNTPLHEVGHAYFRNILNDDQRAGILEEVRTKHRQKKLTDAAAEELLVEDLKEHVFKKGKRESRYGKMLSKLIEMAQRLVTWLGVNPEGKISQFYEDILSKKRPSERAAFTKREQEIQAFQEEDPYIGVHNTTLSKLESTVELGGFPMPSIAVLPASTPFDEYGDITVIFKKNVYDPMQGAYLFDRDAYTPISVKPEYDFDGKRADKVHAKVVESLRDDYKAEFRAYKFFPSMFKAESLADLTYQIRRGNSVPIAMVYLQKDGRDFDLVRDRTVGNIPAAFTSLVEQFGTYGEMEAFNATSAEQQFDMVHYYMQERRGADLSKEDYTEFSSDDKRSFFTFAYRFINENLQNKVDEYAVSRKIQDILQDDTGLDAWVKENYGPLFSEGYIKVGRQKLPYTAENVVRAMEREDIAGANGTTMFEMNLSKARASAAESVSSLAEAKTISLSYDPDVATRQGELRDQINSAAFSTEYNGSDYGFERPVEFFKAVKDYYKGSKLTAEALQAKMSKREFVLSADEASELSDALNEFLYIPDTYLEGKPSGVVPFTDISAVLANAGDVEKISTLLPGVPVFSRGNTTLADLAVDGSIEVFQEADASDDGDDAQFSLPDIEEPKTFAEVMSLTNYDVLPAREQQNYMTVAKDLLEADKNVREGDLESVEQALYMANLAYKYDQHLLKTYGVGMEQLLLEIANHAQERAEDVLTYAVVSDEMSIFPKSTRQSLARDMLNVAQTIARIVRENSTHMGRYVDEIFGHGYDDIYSIVERYIRDNGAAVTEREMQAWKQYKSIGDAATEAAGDIMGEYGAGMDESKYQEELMETVRRAISGNRVYKSRIYEEADMIAEYAEKVAKEKDRVIGMRARLADIRARRIEREQMLEIMKKERRLKAKVQRDISKMNIKMKAELRGFEAGSKETRKEARANLRAERQKLEDEAKASRKALRDAYRLARQRREITKDILDLKAKMQKRIREGKFVDVEYSKKLLALFDTFQKSQVTQATLDKLDALLEDQANGVFASVGSKDETTGEKYTQEQAEADVAYNITRIRKRLTQVPLSSLSVEDLDMLYTQIRAVVELGRNKLLLNRYMSEEQKAARLADILEGTKNIDSGMISKMAVAVLGEDFETTAKNAKQNVLEMVPAYSVTDTIDGAKLFKGKNTGMLKELNQAEYAFTREKSNIADDLVAGYKALGLPKELTRLEQDFLTYVARLREGEHGEFVAKQILDQRFGGVSPESVGRLTMIDAEAVIDLLQGIHAKYNITPRLGGAYEARTNKIFTKAESYVAPSKFRNPPKEWVSAEEQGIDIMQTFGRNGYGVNDKFSLSRVAADIDLVPRTDLFNLWVEGVENSLWYIHMQPAIDNVQQVVGTKEYGKAAGIGQTWWKEHLTLMAQRGQRVGANKFDMLDIARSNVVSAILSLKATSILIQVTQPITAAFTALPLVGARASMNVFYETLAALTPGYMEKAMEASGAVVTRRGTAGSYDVADARRIMQKDANKARNIIRSGRNALLEAGMAPMQALDVRFSAASRQAVYKALIGQGLSEEEASVQADFTMEVMNSSALVSNKPHIYSRGSIQRFFLMLQSFSIGWFSLMTTIAAGTLKSGSARQYAYGAIAVLGAPLAQALYAKMIYAVQDALLGRDFEDEEEDNPLVMIAKEYLYNVPLAGGIIRSKVEYGKDAWNPVITSLFRTYDGIETAFSEDDPGKRAKAIAKATEGAFTLLGVPFTAQGFDLLEPYLKTEKEKKSANLKSAGKQLRFGAATQVDIDQATKEALIVTYGDRMKDLKDSEKTAARKSVVKAMATETGNEFVQAIAGANTNDEKATVLIEASERLNSESFSGMIADLRKYNLLSDEGYKKYLEKKHK